MKIVSWNLLNISFKKLTKTFQPAFQAYGLGNNILDYIINVVMGNDNWEDVVSPFPPDVFIVIELKTGGTTKGGAVTGKCLNTLAALTGAMNNAVVRLKHSTSDYNYVYLTPKLTGRHETVGFIVNRRALTPTALDVERDQTTNTFLNPRTPLFATFRLVEKPATILRISGIHAPPPKGGPADRLRPPINWCAHLVNTPTAAAGPISFFSGDFNCQPGDTYVNGLGVNVGWSAALAGFNTGLPNNTLSSVRKALNAANAGKAVYLSSSYDSSIFNIAASTKIADQDVPDLIGQAKNANAAGAALYPGHGVGVLNAYRRVSDHLPVITEFNVM